MAKPTPSVRRDDSETRRFAVETDARAGTRHALEAARGRAVAAADLAERRDAQRAVAEKAGRNTAASGASSAALQDRPGSTESRRATDLSAKPDAADRRRDGVSDKDERRPDAAAKGGKTDDAGAAKGGTTDDAVAAKGKEQESQTETRPDSAERDEPSETPTASQAVPGMNPPSTTAPPPIKAQQTGPASDQTTGPSLGQAGAAPAQAVATAQAGAVPAQAVAAAQAEAANSLDAATGGADAAAKVEPETAFAAHLDPVAALNAAPSGLGHAASGVDAPPAASAAPHQGAPVPLGAVPMTIGLRSLSGSSHFEIRLDPVDLGRIDVKLDIDKDQGTVTTRVVVDRPETLALLQRDSGNLQQALSQAGLDSSAGISLSLRGDGMSGERGSGDRRPDGGTEGRGVPASDLATTQVITDSLAPRILRGIAGIDIRI